MSSTANSDYKSQVLAATDIVTLIGQSVALKKRGKDFLGLCPFHQEKTPSFHVSPAKQFFYCYGCKAGGNAIDFVMKRDRIEFLDAMKLLGEAAGIPMPRYAGSKEKSGERQTLLEAHSAAASLFENQLASPIGLAARQYLEKRGFNQDSLRRFQIGLALDSWDSLLRAPQMRKFPPQMLALAGLVKPRENGSGFYDTFRNRIIFPIRDESGRIIAFGGRVIPGSPDPAKYLNSPETPLFSKGRCVFGIDLAKHRITETRTVAIVEGYTDVVMAHQYGAANVVSILGTAMTEQHLSLLRRFADRIVLLFDPDFAGDNAVDRAVELFLSQPVEMAIASLSDGLDPDEYLVKFGTDAFNKVLSDATDVLTYKWRQLDRRFKVDANDLTGQQNAVQQYLEVLANARGSGTVDAIRWGGALARVSRLTGIPIDDLNRRFKIQRAPKAPPKRIAAPAPTDSAPDSAQGADADLPTDPVPVPQGPPTARDRAERQILGVLLAQPSKWHNVQARIGIDDFTEPVRRQLAEVYWAHQRDEGEPVFREILALLQSPALKELAIGLIEEIEALTGTGSEPVPASGSKTAAGAPTPTVDQVLETNVNYLVQLKQHHEEQKLIAELVRSNDPQQPGDPQAQKNALFDEFVKKNQATNLRRIGPVRRSH